MKRLFWDIETTPNVALIWRAGRRLNVPPENIIRERAICCIAYKWEGEDKVYGLKWDSGDDKDMLKQFLIVANEADELVAHYGDKFDLKWFQGRCLMHDFSPLPDYKTVDTQVIASRRFSLNSTKLDYLGKVLVGKQKLDAPYSLWKQITIEDDGDALEQLLEYCMHDVVLLEEVYHKIASYHPPKSHAGVLHGGPKWSCPYCTSINIGRSKVRTTAKGTIQHQMKCHTCLRYYTISNKSYEDFNVRNTTRKG